MGTIDKPLKIELMQLYTERESTLFVSVTKRICCGFLEVEVVPMCACSQYSL